MTAAVGAAVTLPGYLVKIDFATPVRLSSRGDVSWTGWTWAAWDVRISGLGIDGAKSSQNGRLVLGNSDYTIGALVLSEGVAGRAVNIWKFYTETPALADPVLVFSGVADSATCEPNGGTVTLDLQQSGGITLYCPRTYINRASGHSFVPAAGTLVQWNGETYRLEPEAI
jgi:hypothetical protein